MKIIFTLFLLPLLISLNGCAAKPVLDTDGDSLVPGANYFIMPLIPSAGRVSGITMEYRLDGRNRCPLDVVVEPTPLSYGRPFSFTIQPKIGYVPTSIVVNIESFGSAYCREFPTIWGVVDVNIAGGGRWITSGGSKWSGFTIEEETTATGNQLSSYKFKYCAAEFGSDVTVCDYVSISSDDEYGRKRLVVGGEPMLVSFKKAAQKSEDLLKMTVEA